MSKSISYPAAILLVPIHSMSFSVCEEELTRWSVSTAKMPRHMDSENSSPLGQSRVLKFYMWAPNMYWYGSKWPTILEKSELVICSMKCTVMTRFLTAIIIIWNTCIIANGLHKCRKNLFCARWDFRPIFALLALSLIPAWFPRKFSNQVIVVYNNT